MDILPFLEGDLSTLPWIPSVFVLGTGVFRQRNLSVSTGTMRRGGLKPGTGKKNMSIIYVLILIIFLRPCREPDGEEGGDRVPPSELDEYRRHHHIRFPCCLCPMASAEPDAYTEASIFLVTTGRLAGEYVASCPTGKCKYWGKLFLLVSSLSI